MGNVLAGSLYKKDVKRFEKISDASKEFYGSYCGNSILGVSVFRIIENYARKKEMALELLRYPFRDEELWAVTFVKKGTVFLCINSELAVCKQIFASAHELYHIRCYAEGTDTDTIRAGSVLDSGVVDEAAMTQEDLEANAFAGLLLMPYVQMREQLGLYGIDEVNIETDDILTMMEIFAIPYKAVILRLFEEHVITEARANELLQYETEYIAQRVELTGKAKQWQLNSKDLEHFGSLLDNLEFNSQNELLTVERVEADRKFLEKIRADFCREG